MTLRHTIRLVLLAVLGSGPARLGWVEESAAEKAQAKAEEEVVQEGEAICGIDPETGVRTVRAR
jgi:hypothetical protein